MKTKNLITLLALIVLCTFTVHAQRHYRGIAYAKVEHQRDDNSKGSIYYVYATLGENNVKEEAGMAGAREWLLQQLEKDVRSGEYKFLSTIRYDIELSPEWSYRDGYKVPSGGTLYGGSASVMCYNGEIGSGTKMIQVNESCEKPLQGGEKPMRAIILEHLVQRLNNERCKARYNAFRPAFAEPVSFTIDTCIKR